MRTSRNSPDITRMALVAVLIFAIVACKTREVGQGLSQEGELVFSDDFDSATLSDKWSRGSGEGGAGQWSVQDGALHGRNLRNDPLWYAEPLPKKTRIEFDARAFSSEGDIKVEIFGDGERHASGYVLIFGGWNNSLDVIARLDEHGDDRKERPSKKVEPERTYRFAIERTDGELRWFVDGEPFMSYPDPQPLRGSDHAHFAFSNWNAPVAFDNFRVYRLPRAGARAPSDD